MSRRLPSFRVRRSFTLLETMLAAVLGALILFTCLGMFGSLSRSDRRQEARLTEAMEFALAQRAITTGDADLAEKVRMLRNYGRSWITAPVCRSVNRRIGSLLSSGSAPVNRTSISC